MALPMHYGVNTTGDPAAEWLTACGQDKAAVQRWTDLPEDVTCAACMRAMPAEAVMENRKVVEGILSGILSDEATDEDRRYYADEILSVFSEPVKAPLPVPEPVSERFHLEVQYGGSSARWGRPNVGGIEDGFDSPKDAEDLASVLRRMDRDYYAGCAFRIVKITKHEIQNLGTEAI